MPAVTASVCSTLLFFGIIVFVSADQKIITAESGQNIILTCRALNNNLISAVEWSRDDLRDEYVLFYRNKQLDSDNQHPSFKNRVDLQDRQMKDGDASLILKNVTINDAGTYKCHVFMSGTNPQNNNPASILYLHVVPPGQPGGHTEDGGKEDGGKEDGSVGLKVGLPVAAAAAGVVVVAFVGVVIYRKCSQPKHRQNSCQQTDDLQHGNGSVSHTESEKPPLLKETEG